MESVPFPGVTLLRDRFDVPHVYAKTRQASIETAGWILAEDRGLLLQQARYNSRVAVIDAPGLSAIGLTAGLQTFKPSAQTEAFVSTETKALKRAGKEGKAVLRDIDAYVAGINAYLAATHSTNAPWTRNDVYAVNALKGQFLGQGGGREAQDSEFLNGLQQQLGRGRGFGAYNDFRQFKNPRSVTSISGTFPYGHIPKKHPGAWSSTTTASSPPPPCPPASPAGSLRPRSPCRPATSSWSPAAAPPPATRSWSADRRSSYFFPGLVLEMDMHAPHNTWRGATSAPFPGYLLIGRTARFSTTLTSASSDIVDEYAETLCGGSTEKYMYKGKCRVMGHFDAGTLNGKPVTFLTTVHGPVQGYGTVHGRYVAISEKRSSYGKDVLDQLYFRRLSDGQVKSPETFFKAASLTPQTFNSFYIDKRHIAEYTSGRDPIRPSNVDPGLPTKGTGKYEWRGFLKPMAHMHGQDNKSGYMTNWNNGAARGFGAADDQWNRNGSVGRVNLLTFNLKRLQKKGRWSPASIASAMNASATQDVRAIVMLPLLDRLLRGTTAPSPMAQQMLDLLNQWRQHGGNRLDLNGTARSTIRAPRSWMPPIRTSSTTSSRPGSGRRFCRSSTASPAAGMRRRGASTRAGTSTSTATSAACWPRRRTSRRPLQPHLLRQGPPRPLPLRGLERDPGSRRSARRSAGPRSRRLAGQRDGGADPLQPAAAAHDGLHEPAERHPAGHLVQ